MRCSKFTLLLLLVLSFGKAFSQTLTVSSNADSGPGTLRAALESIPSANTANSYVIQFNLSGSATDANRTIRLRSALPVIPSNVVIDGSSQNWPALGVSGAKIILEPEFPGSSFSGLRIGQYQTNNLQTKGVEIYGLYLRNFATLTSLQNLNTNQGSGIVVDYRANNIKIGAPGKGNVICGNINGILIQNSTYYEINPLTDISIQSNLIGIMYDGYTANPNMTGISASLYDCALTVGGDNTGEGNVISANQYNLNISRYNYYTSTGRFNINIIGNKIGTDYSGTKDYHELPLFLSSSSLEIYGIKLNAQSTNLFIRNNIISGNRTWGIAIANADFTLTGNSIGTGVSGTEELGNGGGVRIEDGATGNIGGPTPAETNRIGYNGYGIESISFKPVKITRNSMFCNRIFGIGKALNNFQPYVQILKKSPSSVSGRATPNSTIELFYTQNCQGFCEGKTYIGTVPAGSDGRWQYTGTINGSVTATASLLNATTSPFSTTALLENEAVIEPVTCKANGSINIPEPREGITFTWNKIINNIRTPLGHDQKITNLDVGSYEVIIDDGCKSTSQVFEIKDQKLTIPEIEPVNPQCGQRSFTFKANVFRGKGVIQYEWHDAQGKVAEGQSVNLPEGSYKVVVTDEAGCKQESVFLTIKRKPAPLFDFNTMDITYAACGKQNGSVKNIKVTDLTGTASYQWYTYDQRKGVMGPAISGQTSLDLENVAGDLYYVLEVSDQGTCSPARTQPIYIPVYNSVTISAGQITHVTCSGNNGAIEQVLIGEANRYEWFDPSGQSIGGMKNYDPATPPSLKNLSPGTYKLVASNSNTPCTNFNSFIVNQIPKTEFNFNPSIQPATCDQDNGSIILSYNPGSQRPTRYKWVESTLFTEVSGTNSELRDLKPGSYTFFTYDINGCETTFGPYVINKIPLLVVEPSSGKAVNDGCSLSRGSVTGIVVHGGIEPYSFSWKNEAGELVQTTQQLINVPGGKYQLTLKDNTSCGLATSEWFTIENPSFIIPPPVVKDLRTCYATEIMLPVIAPEEGTYQLFSNLDDDMPTLETKNGKFIFKIAKTADYFIRRKLGSCVSNFTKVHVEVTNDNLEVMNTMTPNGDGLNDTWVIKGLPEHSDYNIKLYTRSGQLVYESIGKYTKPFDGNFRGKELPAGVYYFKIDLRADCNPLGGSLTLLR
ncbi:gliding motility-associated C-terminal domain-containing protein [Pedobacter sp.]|jgi:gliding motility-associated-like protein|uniref:gliding motility-associated C-terminal domain-containing protein n=1 Tax=Pedobacter sp. TaxID=1411316 RepID=UPI002C42FB27|nr:gliding motility-associated C-terminal domain-containing protein [Pedobacter sp.]HWW38141.1 gliding motility-associated C-terminal domain-containing protein [Pedobacter sp.]